MDNNILLMADYYKHTHHLLWPEKTEYVHSYIESRGTPSQDVLFFGLQGLLKQYLLRPDIGNEPFGLNKAQSLINSGFGKWYFNMEGWGHIYTEHKNKLPIHIRALPEGSIVPRGTPLITIENTDSKCWWLPQYLETMLDRLWYPTTVATRSMEAKRIIKEFCDISGCEVSPFHLLDFGARGATCHEAAAIGGASHLLNFQGTDNIEGVKYLMDYYNAPVSGFSVMASEHSVTMAYGRKGELDAYKRFFAACPPEATISIVIDTYDDMRALRELFDSPELRDTILTRPGTTVFRPDSGNIHTKPLEVMKELWRMFGGSMHGHCHTYARLNPKIKVLQGDGISDLGSLREICKSITDNKFCMSNIMLGMGAGLLQNCTRSTYDIVMKASEVTIDGNVTPVQKAPKSDPFKNSKSGRFNDPRLETVFLNGELMREQSLHDIKRVINED
jgi:nicotinamide phosphoribosyltransferase